MKCKERLEAFLRENKVPYQLHHHPLAYTAQEVAASEHVSGKMMAKVVLVFARNGQERMVMVVLPAPLHVDVEKAAQALGAKSARLARESEFAAAFPDCEVGAMPPFGNFYDVPVFVEEALTKQDHIIFRAGTHTDTIALKYSDFERLAKPKVVEVSSHIAC